MGKRSKEPDNPTNSSRSEISVHFKIRTVKVTNISVREWKWVDNIKKFFAFTGEIDFIQMIHGTERTSDIAYVTFKDPIAAEISALLSGATIVNQPATIDLAPDYKLPDYLVQAKPIVEMSPQALAEARARTTARFLAERRDQFIISCGADPSAVRSARNAEEIMILMIAAGFILGENAISKAKSDFSAVKPTIRTVKVNEISVDDIKKFFSFLGEIDFIQVICGTESRPQIAYVTFKDPMAAAISVLLSGSRIVDQPVTIDLVPDYKLPDYVARAKPIVKMSPQIQAQARARAHARSMAQRRDQYLISSGADPFAVRSAQNAEEIVTLMLAANFILGENAISKAKSFDEKYQLTSTASATKQD